MAGAATMSISGAGHVRALLLALTLLIFRASSAHAAPAAAPAPTSPDSPPDSDLGSNHSWLDDLYPANLAIGSTRRFPLTAPARGTEWSTDPSATCRALSVEIPSLLSRNPSSLDGQRYNLTNAIAIFYPEGVNPALKDLAADIPPGAIVPGKDDLPQSINNDVDWTSESIKADQGYGYQDSIQTQLGGLPSFCRFGASILTSSPSTSQVWFEVWMPLPNVANSTTTTTADCDGPAPASSSANVTAFVPPQPALNQTFSCPTSSSTQDGSQIIPLDTSSTQPGAGSPPSTPGLPGIVPLDQPAGKQTTFGTSSSALPPTEQNSSSPPSSSDQQDGTANATASWRPASRKNWKGRLIFSGNAGLRGNIPYAELKQTLTRYREAAAGTNGGHFSSGAGSLWARGPNNTESLLDFGSRGAHVATVAAAEVVKLFYGVQDRPVKPSEPPSSSPSSKRLGFALYFKGCSTGGRQAFGEAQKYPDDYDGILAGAPAFDYSSLNAYQIYVNSLQADKKGAGYIPTNLYPLIHRAVLEACDAEDGAVDGIVGNALSCKPDFTQLLLCKTAEEADAATIANAAAVVAADTATAPATCLTAPQIQNLERIYQPYNLNGTYIHGPVLPSSEFGWTVNNGVTGTPFSAAPAYYQYWLGQRTDEPSSFDYYKEVTPEVIQKGRETDPGSTDNFSPDLSSYFSRGSRIIHYHGLSDQLIPPGKSIQYWRRAVKKMGLQEVNKHYRLFLVPGMQHCRQGDGAYHFGGASQFDQPGWRPLKFDTAHDMLLSLFDWTELGAGHAPYYQIGASYLRNATIESSNPPVPTTSTDVTSILNGIRVTRRLCPYPKVPTLLDQKLNLTRLVMGTGTEEAMAAFAQVPPANATKAEDYKCIGPDGSFDESWFDEAMPQVGLAQT